CWAFGVTLADDHEGGGLHIFDETNGRTFFINSRIVVNGRAEERDHPLIDQILPIVTLPIRDASTGDGGAEAIRLRHGPHSHEPAVAPAGHTETVGIDWIFLYRCIDSGEIVAQVAAPKILHVCTREIFTLAVASTGIWKEHVIIACG